MRVAPVARRGFTLIELLIILALILIFAGLSVLVVHAEDNMNNRINCARNLKMIGMAMLLYSNENRGAYPRTNYDPATADKPTCFTNPRKEAPTEDESKDHIDPAYIKAGPKANDITAAIFRLLATQDISPDVFICPSSVDPEQAPPEKADAATHVNFTDGRQLSYSFANPYPNAAAVDAGFKYNNSMSAEIALAADLNPGVDELLTVNATSAPEEMKKVNTKNHNGGGHNVLYADGHVEFTENPFVSVERDNIYTYGKSGKTSGGEGIVGSPANDKDSILLPTAKQAPATQPVAQ
jgi:prepilin-type processing-associated H-X9-DG protein/prepilin-type N-terminal cleavage/methylation domain-containing protein